MSRHRVKRSKAPARSRAESHIGDIAKILQAKTDREIRKAKEEREKQTEAKSKISTAIAKGREELRRRNEHYLETKDDFARQLRKLENQNRKYLENLTDQISQYHLLYASDLTPKEKEEVKAFVAQLTDAAPDEMGARTAMTRGLSLSAGSGLLGGGGAFGGLSGSAFGGKARSM